MDPFQTTHGIPKALNSHTVNCRFPLIAAMCSNFSGDLPVEGFPVYGLLSTDL